MWRLPPPLPPAAAAAFAGGGEVAVLESPSREDMARFIAAGEPVIGPGHPGAVKRPSRLP